MASPPISTVIPWILEATGGHIRFRAQSPHVSRGDSVLFCPNKKTIDGSAYET